MSKPRRTARPNVSKEARAAARRDRDHRAAQAERTAALLAQPFTVPGPRGQLVTAHLGPDVDLDAEVVLDSRGRRYTEADAEADAELMSLTARATSTPPSTR